MIPALIIYRTVYSSAVTPLACESHNSLLTCVVFPLQVDFAASVEDQVLAALDVSKGGRRWV